MDQPQPFNQKQREMFARLLADAKKRAEAELEAEGNLDQQVESEVIPRLVQERGATDLIGKLRTLRKEVDEAEEALGALGFSCDEDSVSLKWNGPKDLCQALDAAKRAARKGRQGELTKFDRAILAVWAAEDAQKAKKIVEDLL